MRKTQSSRRAALILAVGMGMAASALGQAGRPPTVGSPMVKPDRTIVFRFRAPDARKVELSGQFLTANQPMVKDESGWWSVTVGPVAPDLYPYNFVVDGVGVADPANQHVFPNEGFKASLVDIPDPEPALRSVQNVPHGELTYGFYESKALGCTRPLVTYTPPGYRAGSERYPVLYLVSGTTDTEETWFRVGRVNFILDNLIAQRRAVPMIVVMPYGNMLMGTPRPTSLEAAGMYKAFADELVGVIVPYVETNFRAIPEREKRGIAGFSRGGGQSLFTAFSHLDKFAWVGSYSAYLTPEVFDKYFPAASADPAATNRQLKLLWLGVGKDDFLFPQASAFIDLLAARKIEHRKLITEGGHTWMNARHFLAETLQLYFK